MRIDFAHPAQNVGTLSIQQGMVIADLGAGSGHYTLEFARRLDGLGRVYAVDVQSDLLRRIQREAALRRLQGVEIIHGDIERERGTKLADRHVDLALLSNVLFQLEQPLAALREAWRIVRPTGSVVVIEWADSPSADGRRLGPAKKHVLGEERALELAQEASLQPLYRFDAGAHHFGLAFKPVPFSRV